MLTHNLVFDDIDAIRFSADSIHDGKGNHYQDIQYKGFIIGVLQTVDKGIFNKLREYYLKLADDTEDNKSLFDVWYEAEEPETIVLVFDDLEKYFAALPRIKCKFELMACAME